MNLSSCLNEIFVHHIAVIGHPPRHSAVAGVPRATVSDHKKFIKSFLDSLLDM